MRLPARVPGSRGSKGLRGSAKDFFKLAAEMGFTGEFEFGDDSFVGVALSDELLGQTALQVAEPAAGCAVEVLAEKALQLSILNGTKRCHFGGIEVCFIGHLLPLFH